MKVSTMFPSKYLRADDCAGPGMILTIRSVEMEKMSDDDRQKPVVHFTNHVQGLVLNKTNTDTIVHSYGDESNDWVGRPLLLTSHMVLFKGTAVAGIHVQIPAQGQTQPAQPQQPQLPPGVAEQKVATAPAPPDTTPPPEQGQAIMPPVVGITGDDIPF